MKLLHTISSPPSLNVELVVADGPRTHLTGLAYDKPKPYPAWVTVEAGKKPVMWKLAFQPVALHQLDRGFLFVARDLAVFEDDKKLTPAMLSKPLNSPLGEFPHGQVTLRDADEGYAVLAEGKKGFRLHRWRRGEGWSSLGLIPDLAFSDVFAPCCAWAARREVLVVVGTLKDKSRIAEFDGSTWKTFSTRPAGLAQQSNVSALRVLGGRDVIAVGGPPTLLLGEGLTSTMYGRHELTLEVASAPGPSLRHVRNDFDEKTRSLVWRVESLDLRGQRDLALLSEERGRKKFSKPEPRPSKKKKPSVKDAVALDTLFKPGLALCVVDALLAARKSFFDFDGWIEQGLSAGTLTLDETEDVDRVRAWREQEEYDLNTTLHDALVRLPVSKAQLASVKKLTLSLEHVIAAFCQYWDGESELGEKVELRGLEHLDGLTEIEVGDALDPAPLLACKRLKKVRYVFTSHRAAHHRVLDTLEKRGVAVKCVMLG